MIPVGWLYSLEHIAPGAFVALMLAWVFAVWFTHRANMKSAQRRADELELTGEERENFLVWRTQDRAHNAVQDVAPVAVVTWCALLAVGWSTGLLSFSSTRTLPPESSGNREAVVAILEAAKKGDADSQFRLGTTYERGEGVRSDDREALKWYLLAAEQGHLQAQFYAGQSYYHGYGTAVDLSKAAHWYGKAAHQGDALAQFTLGAMLEHDAAFRDLEKARYWYTRSALQDFDRAKEALARLGTQTR